ncbi:MAG: hypothetical protein WAZ97_11015 [Pseudolabrys sp.]
MRQVVALALLVGVFVVPFRAGAASVEELFRHFNLFGTWATNCQTPPTPANPYVNIVMPSAGLILEDHNLGPDYAVNRYSVLSAEQVSPMSVAVNVIFQPGTDAEERQKLIFSVRDKTRRTMFNQTDGGTVRVKDGIALARGSKTPLLRKCEDVSHHQL